MFVARALCWSLAVACTGAALPSQIPLAEVAKIARARAERSRPAQQKALEPYWADLALPYQVNRDILEKRIGEVAALGDSVVPLLLEKLAPSQSGASARDLASNCRRVLERMDPGSFLDALVELANGTHEIGRTEAIRLLGVAQAPQAVPLLIDLLDRTSGEDKLLVVRSLRLQKAAAAAPKIVPMLASNDPRVREEVLVYLIAARPAQVADTVVQALSTERDNKLLIHYVDYFAGAVKAHEGAATALLPLLARDRLDWTETKRVAQVLATVAPASHEPTIDRLTEIIDGGDTSLLAVQAAVTIRALGDTRGVKKLKAALDEQLRKPKRRNEAALFEQRANLAFAIEDYGDAFADYERALKFTDGATMTRKAYVGQMKCEARRKKIQSLVELIKASGLPVHEIEAIGHDDPVFQETLQHDKVRAALQSLAKDAPPR